MTNYFSQALAEYLFAVTRQQLPGKEAMAAQRDRIAKEIDPTAGYIYYYDNAQHQWMGWGYCRNYGEPANEATARAIEEAWAKAEGRPLKPATRAKPVRRVDHAELEKKQQASLAGVASNAPETKINSVLIEYHTDTEIHQHRLAPGRSHRWMRVAAAVAWPEVTELSGIRVRVFCEAVTDDHRHDPVDKKRVLLDLDPEKMGIDVTDVAHVFTA